MTFMERLRRRWERAHTLLCVGLDGELERMPAVVRAGAGAGEDAAEAALVAFHQGIVEATADLVCAFKPNSAFFEAHGPAGMRALQRIIAFIHDRYSEVPVLLDAKRGDVGSTSQAYARAAFEVYDADAITLQPYLGAEALRPFLERADRGLFILCRTSNPRAGEFQDLRVSRDLGQTSPHAGASLDSTASSLRPVPSDQSEPPPPLYLYLARRVAETWNGQGNCGLVVGATYPRELAAVRAAVGDLPILVPGIGAQGGAIAASVRAGRDSRGHGLLLSASRGVLYASTGPDYAEAARREATRLRDEIERARGA
ncbi:MAG: orotidine-5'-phosphate decarboxylase [Ktedonobacterales bacterium]|nr:orotidine-5'-phosphate decarboxylase [Ktedonobacterales bacterium]